MTDSVFTQTTETQETPAAPSNPFADKLGAIKNEHGEPKYKDVDTALDALRESQTFIETLKAEKAAEVEKNVQLAAELEKRQSVDEALKRFANPQEPQTPTKEDPPVEQFSEDRVMDVVNEALNRQEQNAIARRNLDTVSTKLTEAYGDKVQEVVSTRAKELGMQVSEMETLSKQNPTLVLQLFDNVQVQDKQSITSTQNPPRNPENKLEAPTFEHSLMTGATDEQLREAFRKSKEYTNKRLGVET